jgi:DNA-directed RNA polymerase subunit K/omega
MSNYNDDEEDTLLQDVDDVTNTIPITNVGSSLKLKKKKYDDDEDLDEEADDENKEDVDENEDEDIDDNEDEDDDDFDPDEDDDDDGEGIANNEKKSSSKSNVQNQDNNLNENVEDNEDEDDDDYDDDENYLKKFDKEVKNQFLESYHPEVFAHNYEEVKLLSNVVRDENNIINDPLHKTLPFLTKFEKSRILGQRAKQLDSGAQPFVNVEKGIIDGYVIALKELEQKAIPFIIKRPLPNGGFEYWRVSDLEIVC